jgi:hypothetical protein
MHACRMDTDSMIIEFGQNFTYEFLSQSLQIGAYGGEQRRISWGIHDLPKVSLVKCPSFLTTLSRVPTP